MKIKNQKRGFPWGIMIFTLVLLSILSAAISCGYFYHTLTNRITEIEADTKKYSINMIETLGNVAELSFCTGNYDKLVKLLREKMGQNNLMEAFFVLSDGKIVAHSNSTMEKQLEGNIINDEFSYNIDMIFLPLQKKTGDVLFLDYNIISQKIPFNKSERKYIKQYLYKGIGSVGWLATRAVYNKNKAVGTINFIIGKQRIYSLFYSLLDDTKILLIFLFGTSLIISLMISITVSLRIRGLEKVDVSPTSLARGEGMIGNAGSKIRKMPPGARPDGKISAALNIDKEKMSTDLNVLIKDAIPINE